MPQVEVKDRNNTTVGTITFHEIESEVQVKQDVLHSATINFLANQRQGTHATKTRGLVRGGGRKPWRQKHTGRARAGSNRSPIWKGGGIIFGPQPRDYSYKLPKKMKKLAFMAAFYERLSRGEVLVIDSFSIEKPKTKEMIIILKNLGIYGKKVLIVISNNDNTVFLSARNIPGVAVMRVEDLNTYDTLINSVILITKEAANKLEAMKEL
jgi:large subunit ribosomal protein L4